MNDLDLNAELTAINFLLEFMLTSAAANAGQTSDDIERLAEEAVYQMSLPGTTYGGGQNVELEQLRELATHRVAMMFSRVRERLKQVEQGPHD